MIGNFHFIILFYVMSFYVIISFLGGVGRATKVLLFARFHVTVSTYKIISLEPVFIGLSRRPCRSRRLSEFVFIYHRCHYFSWQLTSRCRTFPEELGLLWQFMGRWSPCSFYTLEPCCLSVGRSELSVRGRTGAWSGKTSEMSPLLHWQLIENPAAQKKKSKKSNYSCQYLTSQCVLMV